jgi:hypothetical protein
MLAFAPHHRPFLLFLFRLLLNAYFFLLSFRCGAGPPKEQGRLLASTFKEMGLVLKQPHHSEDNPISQGMANPRFLYLEKVQTAGGLKKREWVRSLVSLRFQI